MLLYSSCKLQCIPIWPNIYFRHTLNWFNLYYDQTIQFTEQPSDLSSTIIMFCCRHTIATNQYHNLNPIFILSQLVNVNKHVKVRKLTEFHTINYYTTLILLSLPSSFYDSKLRGMIFTFRYTYSKLYNCIIRCIVM